MFNFNFYFLLYLIKQSSPITFNFLPFEKRYLLTQLQMHPELNFLSKNKTKIIYIFYSLQKIFLFSSFVFLGFFLFSLLFNFFYSDNITESFLKIWNDFINLHYISFFIVLLSLFSFSGLINSFIQFKLNQKFQHLKSIDFSLDEHLEIFDSDLFLVEKLPIFNMIKSNNNLYGVFLLLSFEKHIELQEIKLISNYFKK